MFRQISLITAGLAGALLCSTAALAQRGVGDPVGVARQPVLPAVVTLKGTLQSIETGPCSHTTGHARIGTHVILQAAEERQLNVHLGPASTATTFVGRMKVGEPVKVEAFRTERMPADHYVAKSITFGNETVRLCDESLRPIWAGTAPGPRFGPGPYAGYGRGAGRGPCYYRGLSNGAPFFGPPSMDVDEEAVDTRPHYGRQARGMGYVRGYGWRGRW